MTPEESTLQSPLILILKGPFPSKKNRLVRWSNNRIGPDQKSRKQMDDLVTQVQLQMEFKKQLEHPTIIWQMGIRNRAQDPDNIKTTVLDCMVEAGLLRDDNFMYNNGFSVTLPAVRVGKGETPWCRVILL